MPIKKRPQIEPTHDWQQLSLLVEGPEQRAYEVMRTRVLFGQSPAERARQTGVPPRSLYRQVERFDQVGMLSLFAPVQERVHRPTLSPRLRQLIVDLKAEYPTFHLREIAAICYVAEGRRPSPHTIQSVLADGPPPARVGRRYPPYHEIADPAQRRLALVRLHAEGWRVSTIAAYMGVSRQTVYTTLRRWVEEEFAGMPDRSRAPKNPTRTVDLAAMREIKRRQENPALGAWRMQAALRQVGIRLSTRTCGRIMALNRDLYGMDKEPRAEPKDKKPMPFVASRRHEVWAVDIRYLDTPHLAGKAYCISILDHFSRAMVASEVLPAQDLPAFLRVLRAAVHKHGVPERLISDGGAVFKANDAVRIYEVLGITKERIDKRQAWQSYLETTFNIQRRMADYYFAQATSWQDLRAIHDRWFADYNYQAHWAHRHRTDGRLSPVEVLGWVHGRSYSVASLDRIFRQRSGRTVNHDGYVRYRHWKMYAERGLVKQPTVVWLCGETLTVEHEDEPLSQFTVKLASDKRHLAQVGDPRLFETRFTSPQPFLWHMDGVEWHKVMRADAYTPRRKRVLIGEQLRLFPDDG